MTYIAVTSFSNKNENPTFLRKRINQTLPIEII
jgi:hypothetical protein